MKTKISKNIKIHYKVLKLTIKAKVSKKIKVYHKVRETTL